jgi:hypothetical protein
MPVMHDGPTASPRHFRGGVDLDQCGRPRTVNVIISLITIGEKRRKTMKLRTFAATAAFGVALVVANYQFAPPSQNEGTQNNAVRQADSEGGLNNAVRQA